MFEFDTIQDFLEKASGLLNPESISPELKNEMFIAQLQEIAVASGDTDINKAADFILQLLPILYNEDKETNLLIYLSDEIVDSQLYLRNKKEIIQKFKSLNLEELNNLEIHLKVEYARLIRSLIRYCMEKLQDYLNQLSQFQRNSQRKINNYINELSMVQGIMLINEEDDFV